MDMKLLKKLLDTINVYYESYDSIEDFYETFKNQEITEDILKFSEKEHNVIWYMDPDNEIEGFITDDGTVYSPNDNRIDFLEAMIHEYTLPEVKESYKPTEDELEELNLRISRNINVMFTKSGRGAISPRITLPIGWLNEMNVTEDERLVNIKYEDGKIIIKKV